MISRRFFFFFFNDTATTEIYTLSLHDALPIFFAEALFGRHVVRRADDAAGLRQRRDGQVAQLGDAEVEHQAARPDRKSTRLNSSHSQISYAVFCLKKKKNIHTL